MNKDENIIEIIANERKKAESIVKGTTTINLIESILDTAIRKLNMFFCLPLLLTDDATPLKMLLGEAELEKYNDLFKDANSEQEETRAQEPDEDLLFYTYNDTNMEILFNGYNADPDMETSDEDRKFYTLLNKLFSKQKVLQVCDQLQGQLFAENKFVIDVLSQLKEIIVKKMKENPLEDQQKEQELSDMVQYNIWAKDELAVLSRKFTMTMNKQAQKIGEKCKEADQIQERTEAVVTHSKEMADFLGRTAENKMVWERKKSEYVQEGLSAEAKKLEAEFEFTFNHNMSKEKNLRVKRYKTEAQLITILKKYDIDIKERDKTYKELLTLFNEEQRQLTEIKDQFETQAVEYHALMDEREEYEKAIWDDKLWAIQKRMAARRIQRYYRDYVALCHVAGYVRFKKRGKGKKKK